MTAEVYGVHFGRLQSSYVVDSTAPHAEEADYMLYKAVYLMHGL